jgi:septin family protein
MTFTDDDLNNLKERIMQDYSTAKLNCFPTEELDSLDALLDRMEAAEQFIEARYPDGLTRLSVQYPLYEAWRKAAGK